MGSSMKLARGLWDHEPPSLSLPPPACKRFRHLAPKTTSHPPISDSTLSSNSRLKSFIRPHTTSDPPKHTSSDNTNKDSPPPVETQPGGTRWNPTQEQIGILEMLYAGGMRTPNAQQIEQITAQLSRYGKIEGKNVFYWFQNHKARERQKLKRNTLGLSHNPRNPVPVPVTVPALSLRTRVGEVEREENSPYKRKCRSWAFECLELEESKSCRVEGDRTLELFPLHPEGR